jgi:hypothetical protein
VQRAVGRAAAEGFVAENASFRKADDRLEQAVQTALSQDELNALSCSVMVMAISAKKGPQALSPVLHFTTE